MQTKLVQIGNSRGVRIPKRILDQCQIEGRLDLNVQGDYFCLSNCSSRVCM